MAALSEPPPPHTSLEVMSAFAPSVDEEATSALELPTAMRWEQPPWRATERWGSAAALCDHYGGLRFSLAPDVQLSLAEYVSYAHTSTADFPYYICERDFNEERAALLEDFEPPQGFADDVLMLAPSLSSRRCVWFVGAERTGSFLHVDPFCSCGWNMCLAGSKRWCFLPPGTDLAALGLDSPAEGPAAWFLDHLPVLQSLAAEGKLRMLEFIQRPGDLVLVPHGWHHAVVNLEFSCAVAHTVATPASLPGVWPSLSKLHPAQSLVLLDVLKHARPQLAAELMQSVTSATGDRGPVPVAPGCSSSPSMPLTWQRMSDEAEDRDEGASLGDTVGTSNQCPGDDEQGNGRPVLFVGSSWLLSRLEARPSGEEAASASASVGRDAVSRLLSYHEQMLSLAATVAEHGAVVCLVRDTKEAHDSKDEEQEKEEVLIRCRAALEEHGVHLEAAVKPSEAEAWARAQSASSVAVVSDEETRAKVIHSALESLPEAGSCAVEVRVTTAAGAALHASRSCGAGDALLRVPLSSCITANDAQKLPEREPSIGSSISEADSESLLRLALLQLLELNPEDPRVRYFREACPPDHFQNTHMACWPEGSPAAEIAANSVAWRRSRLLVAETEKERSRLEKLHGFVVDRDLFLWATMVVRTRAVRTSEHGALLCPCIDVANHRSVGPTAEVAVVVSQDQGCVVLSAGYALDAGDEVTVSYDADADFLDLFERWGFFDGSCVLHTAEVALPLDDALLSGKHEPWRQGLLDELAAQGSDPVMPWSWWVPDFAFGACPLVAAARATLVSHDELHQQSLGAEHHHPGFDEAAALHQCLRRPIEREAESRERVAALLRLHLDGYGPDAPGPIQASDVVLYTHSTAEVAARCLVGFERALLGAHIKALERAPRNRA